MPSWAMAKWCRPPVDELEEEERLARPGDAPDQQAGAEGDARTEEIVELGDAEAQARRLAALLRLRGALQGHPRRVDLDAVVGDDERVLVHAVVGAAHLAELDEALLLARLFPVREEEHAVDDREQRVGLVIVGGVLTDQEGRRLPGHEPHGDLVVELPELLGGGGEIVEDLEAVDDDHRRLDPLEVPRDQRGRLGQALGAEDHAEVDELDGAVVDLLPIEEVELREVLEGLRRRLGEGAEVDGAVRRRRVVEAHLLAQGRLPGAGRPAHDRDGSPGEAAVEDGVEVAHPGLEAPDLGGSLVHRVRFRGAFFVPAGLAARVVPSATTESTSRRAGVKMSAVRLPRTVSTRRA